MEEWRRAQAQRVETPGSVHGGGASSDVASVHTGGGGGDSGVTSSSAGARSGTCAAANYVAAHSSQALGDTLIPLSQMGGSMDSLVMSPPDVAAGREGCDAPLRPPVTHSVPTAPSEAGGDAPLSQPFLSAPHSCRSSPGDWQATGTPATAAVAPSPPPVSATAAFPASAPTSIATSGGGSATAPSHWLPSTLGAAGSGTESRASLATPPAAAADDGTLASLRALPAQLQALTTTVATMAATMDSAMRTLQQTAASAHMPQVPTSADAVAARVDRAIAAAEVRLAAVAASLPAALSTAVAAMEDSVKAAVTAAAALPTATGGGGEAAPGSPASGPPMRGADADETMVIPEPQQAPTAVGPRPPTAHPGAVLAEEGDAVGAGISLAEAAGLLRAVTALTRASSAAEGAPAVSSGPSPPVSFAAASAAFFRSLLLGPDCGVFDGAWPANCSAHAPTAPPPLTPVLQTWCTPWQTCAWRRMAAPWQGWVATWAPRPLLRARRPTPPSRLPRRRHPVGWAAPGVESPADWAAVEWSTLQRRAARRSPRCCCCTATRGVAAWLARALPPCMRLSCSRPCRTPPPAMW
jgi:hypothetical protein